MSEPALALEELQHTFARGTPNEQRALDGVDLVMEERDYVLVVGGNGSGKSTLLNAIAGTLIPDQGRVRIGGRDVTHWPESRRAALVGRVFQNPLWGTIGHCGNPPTDDSALVAVAGILLTLVGWILVPLALVALFVV